MSRKDGGAQIFSLSIVGCDVYFSEMSPKLVRHFFIVLFSVVILSFQPQLRAQKPAELAVKGEKLFTQFSLYYEKNHHITTNYRKGTLIPINTEVEFLKATRKRITVRIPDFGINVDFENEKDYSGEKIDGIFRRTFGRRKVDLAGFSEAEQSAIKKGTVTVGMSKPAVIAAMGYPPRHKTPTLQQDQWRYWMNRFNTILINFESDKVVSIID